MKKAVIICSIAWMVASTVFAAEFRAPVVGKKSQAPRTGEPLKPQTSGAAVQIYKHGFQAVNPLAPASLGKGEKNLTKNIAHNPKPADANDDHKPFGGISLIGWEF